jgi:hypothetical protein
MNNENLTAIPPETEQKADRFWRKNSLLDSTGGLIRLVQIDMLLPC